MSGRPDVPAWPERVLGWILRRDARGLSMLGDLREDYSRRPQGFRRRASYAWACLVLGIEFLPARLFLRADRSTPRWELTGVLAADVRQAARALRRSPSYFAPSVMTLALGVAATVTTYTVVYGALLRPLPFPDSRQLVRLGDAPQKNPDNCCSSSSVPNFMDLRERTRLFSGLAADSARLSILSTTRLSERARGLDVTANYFDILALPTLLGRWFDNGDERAGHGAVVVLSESAWRRHFGGDPSAVGHTLLIDLVPHTIVGIAPASLVVPGSPQFFTPFQWDAATLSVRKRRRIEPIGRLRDGVTIEQARSELRSVFAALAREYPVENGAWTMAVIGFDEWFAGSRGAQSRALLPLIAAGAGILLLVSVLNVTTLTLGYVEHRRREHAVRRALGATFGRLFASRLLESVLVAVPAGLAGTALAAWLLPVVIVRYGDAIPRSSTIHFDGASVAAALVCMAIAALILTLAASARGGGTGADLRQDTRTASSTKARGRRWLVAAQIALASTLLYGALLVGGTLLSLSRVSLGVPLERTQTFAVSLPDSRYPDRERVSAFFETMTSRLHELPEVESAGATSRQPFAGGTNGQVSAADDPSRTEPLTEWRTVTPGFFPALGLRLLSGRTFDDGDPLRDAGRLVASETLARKLFPGQDAVGRHVLLDDHSSHEIIGVVTDVRDFGPATDVRATVYARHGSATGSLAPAAMTFVVRQRTASPSVVPNARALLQALDRDLPLDAPASLEELAERAAGTSRQTATALLTVFTLVAVTLAAVGIFGVVAFTVERRTRELGIRMALGDTPHAIRWRVLREGGVLAVAGVLAGSAGMIWTARLLDAFLVASARPSQMAVMAAVIAVLLLVSLLACVWPARRAAHVSVVEALRAE